MLRGSVFVRSARGANVTRLQAIRSASTSSGTSVLSIGRKSRHQKLPWQYLGATIAVFIGQSSLNDASCESLHILTPPKATMAVSEASLSLIEQLVTWYKSLRKRIKRVIKLLSRFLNLMAMYTPVMVALPFVAIAQYDDLVDTDNCADFWWWKWLRSATRSAGPCTIKLCQWIATRPDLFPFTLCRHLQELQIEATPPTGAEWYDAENAIKKAVGPEWKKLYDIDCKNSVLGSGCIAQVVKGTVRSTQQPIAVKIIHKQVAETIAMDIDIMKYLSSWLEVIPGISNLSITESVHEFSTLMTSQLDLRREARALKKFRRNFFCGTGEKQNHSNRVQITFPKPLPGLAFENVLFETFEPGEVISQYLEGNKKPHFPVDNIDNNKMKKDFQNDKNDIHGDDATRYALARAGLDAMLKMIFEDNFIHADLHMGNIIVNNLRTTDQEGAIEGTKRQGEGLVVSMIDAGLIAELNTEDRRNFLDLFAAIIKNDGREVGRLMIERNRERDNTMTYAQAERFQDRLQEVVSTVHESGMALGRMSLGDLLQKVLVGCYQNNVKLDSKFVSVMLAIGIVEGMGRRLDPDIDILKAAAPHILKASAKFAAFYAAQKLHNAQIEHASRHPEARFESSFGDTVDELMRNNY
jgi:aarF domain-containing kinase